MIERMEIDDGAPAVGWASGPLGSAQAADREIARQTAARARALAEFAASCPASADRPAGPPGCMSADRRASRPDVLADVSEWAAEEAALALSLPTRSAEELLARSPTLVHRLPKTLEALESGLLHVGHLWSLLEKVAPIADRAVRERLERDLVEWVAGRDVTTASQLAAKVRRELLARRVRCAARELADALARRGVSVRPDRADGMAALTVLLTVPEGAALMEALGAYADAVVDDPAAGPPRTRQQKMVGCLLDLVLRPGETDLPVVRAQLTVVAPLATLAGGEQPGEVAGQPVPADLVRALAQTLGLLPDPEPEPMPDPGPGTAPGPAADVAMAEADERWWAEVEARAARGWDEDDPPSDAQERSWAEAAAEIAADPEQALLFGLVVDRLDDPAPLPVPAAPGAAVGADPEPSWWAAADVAVADAGTALLELEQRQGRARRAVEMARIADLADLEAWEQSPGARISATSDALTALAHATAEQRAAIADLLDRTAGGGLADRPRIAVTDALTGALLALTDARDLRARARAEQGLGPPGASPGYRPGTALDRFLRAGDGRCRQPGCRNRVPAGGELDHHQPWPEGPTAAHNLNGFCTRHHRGKHQAPGWTYDLAPDGTLTVTTPTGLTATTTPPPL